MVNTTICSQFAGPPAPAGQTRKIPGGPLYPPREVMRRLDTLSEHQVIAWTDKCIRDLQKWCLDSSDVIELLRIAVTHGNFRSSEWCIQMSDGPWAACDSYSLYRKEFIENAYKEMDIEYYLKFAISVTGSAVLIVSCHPTENRD
ncbi:MAG: hypothetical protein Q8L06_21380 [Pseudohongiella sp.]|nr:hypothetical protein [Pseudohongiella sp.]